MVSVLLEDILSPVPTKSNFTSKKVLSQWLYEGLSKVLFFLDRDKHRILIGYVLLRSEDSRKTGLYGHRGERVDSKNDSGALWEPIEVKDIVRIG